MFPVLGSVQAELEILRPALLGPHRYGHERQAFDLVGVVQSVLQGDARAEGEAAQHQVPVVSPGVQPATQPLGVTLDAAARGAVQMPGQIGSEAAGVMVKLLDVRVGATASAGVRG